MTIKQSDTQSTGAATAILRPLNRTEVEGNIAWWTSLRDEHAAKGQAIGVRRCQEEIDLWKQELEDLK